MLLLLSRQLFATSELGSGTLQISGTTLGISPESQTVPFDTPTIVNTELVGFDPSEGALPDDLLVVGELSGPGIEGVLELTTLPGQPFRIPRLSVKGQYRLDDIRLEQGGQHLAYAEPRSAAILVTQILVTRVSSRPLTLDEIRSYGIIVDGTNTQAYNFTFGFGVEGQVVNYNVPVLYWYDREHPGEPQVEFMPTPGRTRFTPPQMAPFTLQLTPRPQDVPMSGGCAEPSGCVQEEDPPLPGVILFPTDLTLLHQFFSVVLMATNGAPEGDPLTIRDLTARIRLPSGLAAARTDPPTTLGTPVPLRVPGPDGELGTPDDLTFLIAQATAQAEFLVEGLREGTHVVDFDLEGVLEGLPTGIRRISGSARGAVVVRDPTLGVTVSHPDTVLADEEYTMEVTVANNGISPANLVTLALPPSQLAGVVVVGENERIIDSLLPGEAEVVEFRLRPLLTGRVIASFVRADNHIEPKFNLKVGVGEAGIPLSPTEIVLPREVESLPPLVRRHGLGLVGLGFSLSSAPASLRVGKPDVSREEIDQRVFELAQAGRYLALGEDPFEAAAELAVEWTGGPDRQWEWDALRRITRRGALFGDALGQVFRATAATSSVFEVFERFAASTAGLGRIAIVASEGDDSYLEVASRVSGARLYGSGTAADRIRELPFGDLYDLGTGEMAQLAAPESQGYRVTLRRRSTGVADLFILAPTASGELEAWSWPSVGLGEAGRATVEFAFAGDVPTLAVDEEGDGTIDDLVAGAPSILPPRAFRAVAAVQNSRIDKTGHLVDVLFTAPVDLAALFPRDPHRFSIEGKVSDGGTSTYGEGLLATYRSTRIVRVAFNNPLSPYASHSLDVRDVRSALGGVANPQSLAVVVTATMPGTIVEGRMIDSLGNPVPFARIELLETDYSNLPMLDDPCVKHLTAAVLTDVDGRFRFDYVRQTECGGAFEIRGTQPATGHAGKAFGRVRYIAQVVRLDIVLLGRGLVRGRVTYDDGTLPSSLRVIAASPVFLEGRRARIDAQGNYDVGDLPVGPISLSAKDGLGNFALATVELPGAGAVVERDLVIYRHSAGDSTGSLRGRVVEPDGETPIYNAYVALYVEQSLVDVRRSDVAGDFDFGIVPAGTAEIEAFDAETGRSGARVHFEVAPDQQTEVTIRLVDERGSVEGYVYRRQALGDPVPIAGAVVYLSGQPFHATTDANGHYRLDEVVGGPVQIVAADLETQTEVTEPILLTGDGFQVRKDLYFAAEETDGGIAGEFLDRNGTPISGGVVHVAIGDVNWLYETTTDGSGRFTLPDLAPGTYSVHAIRGTDGGSAITTIQYPGHTPFVSIRVRKGSLVGTVRAAQEAGQPVGVRSIVRYRATTVRFGLVGLDTESHDLETDANGNWALPDRLVGPYVIQVFNAFYGERSFTGAISADGETIRNDVLFELAGEIEGVLYDHDGVTPAAGASVSLVHSAFSNYTVGTDEAGRFAFEGLPPDPEHDFSIRAHYESGMAYRDVEVRGRIRRHGERLEVEMRLPVQGSISGRVESAAGAAIVGATVRLRGRSYPYQEMAAQSDAAGAFAFANVQGGEVAIAVQTLTGLGGRATAAISIEGEERQVLVRVESIGSISGRVTSPVDGAVAPNSQVLLWRGLSFFDAATADDQGRFLFDSLPMGYYSLRAFDPRTGRSGRSAELQLDFEGEAIETDIVLEARGSVMGHLVEPGGAVPVPGATIRLGSQGLVPLTTYATTDFEGAFVFEGIPQGRVLLDAVEPGGFRRAAGAGEILHEDEVVVVELVLQESGFVTGTVLEAVAGSAAPFEGPTSIVVYQAGRLVGASTANPYFLGGVLAGGAFDVYAYENGGPHRGAATGILHDEGEVATVDVRFWAMGTVRLLVRDAGGVPVEGAAVRLTGWGPYGFQRFDASTDADGSATFLQVGTANLGASAWDPATSLGGSANAALVVDGALLTIPIALEPSARLEGQVRLADAVHPAIEAQVVVRVSNRTFYAVTDVDGRFVFETLPLGPLSFDLVEHLGPGLWHGVSSLPTAGETVDLGTIVLDDADPQVAGVSPPNGAVGVALSAPIVVTFSEPLSSVYQNGWVELRLPGGGAVPTNAVWSADRRIVTLTPQSALASFTSYQIRARTELSDPAGRHLPQLVQTGFTTVDALPPQVLNTLPLGGAKNVPVSVQFRLVFSESVVLESLSGQALQLLDVDAQAGVATTFTLQPQERELLVTPVDDLAPDHVHRLTVQGVRDAVGNTMTQPFVLEIETADVTPPAIGSIQPPSGATLTSGTPIEISAVVTDNQLAGPVTFRLLGRSATIQPPASGSTYRWSMTVPPVGSPTESEIEVEAHDAAGNIAAASSPISIEPLLDPNAPTVAITCPTTGARLAPGTSVWVTAEASDNQGLLSVEFFLGEGETPVATMSAPPYRYRLTAPSAASEGERLLVRVVATDYGLLAREAIVEVEVVAGAVVTGSRTIGAGDTTFDGQSLVVSGATVTIDGSHSFRDLLVLDGGVVNHREATPAADYRLAIDLERDLYVSCDGSINVSGQGYVGGPRGGGRAQGYGNSSAEGASYFTGASHGGRGGLYDGSSRPYGSVFDPRWPGGGAGGDSNNPGSDGGGVIRIVAGGRAVIDGPVRADGATNLAQGSAGGAIRIDADSISGAGSIEADGGPGGSGGRIALYGDAISPGLAGRAHAWGGERLGTGVDPRWHGAAGTIFLKRAPDPAGELVIDNRGLVSSQWTELPSVGEGIVDTVATNSITDLEARFRDSVVGEEVYFDGDPGASWPIVSHVHLGSTLVLDVAANALTAQPGATYSGRYGFDRVTVRGRAQARVADEVEVTEAASVEAGSVWAPAYLAPLLGTPNLDIVEGTGGETELTLAFTLDRPAEESVSFGWALEGETATAGEDFVAASGTLTIALGQFSATARVRIIGDALAEPDETLRIAFGSPVGARLPLTAPRLTIRDDDADVHCSAPELLVNGGAEDGPGGGTIPGWVKEVGFAWSASSSTAYEGQRSFEPGGSSACPVRLRQDVDVSGFAGPIDSGGIRFTLSGYLETFLGSDFAEVEVEFRDAANANLLGRYSTGQISSLGAWTRVASILAPPPGTRILRARLLVHGPLCDGRIRGGRFDALSIAPYDFPSFAIGDASVVEGTGGLSALSFPLDYACGRGGSATVRVVSSGVTATSGVDFSAVDEIVSFAAGETSKVVTVAVNADAIDESNETLSAALSGSSMPYLRRSTAIGSILDDDTATLSIADVSLAEGTGANGAATLQVSLSTPSAIPVSVFVSTEPGSASGLDDFVQKTQTLVFAPGEVTKSFAVTIFGDAVDEPDESFFVRLSGASGAAIQDDVAEVVIRDDDDNLLTVTFGSVFEGNELANQVLVRVNLTRATPVPVSFQFQTEDFEAIAGSDYVAANGVGNIPTGASRADFLVTTVPDLVIEPTERFRFVISNPVGATLGAPVAEVPIRDDDLTISIADVSRVELDSGSEAWSFPLSFNAVTPFSSSISYSTSPMGSISAGVDYISTSGIMTFPPGTSSGEILVTVRGDLTDEPVEKFRVTISAISNIFVADGVAEGSILDNEPPPVAQFTSPASPGQPYYSADEVHVAVFASDAALITSTRFEFNGSQQTTTVFPPTWSVTVPTVAEETEMPILARVFDGLGNYRDISTTIRALPPLTPPVIHPENVTIAYDLFGLAAIGAPGAVTGPAFRTFTISSRNQATNRVVRDDVRPDGSFSIPLVGLSGETLELRAEDPWPLESEALALGPLAGDEGRIAQLELASKFEAADGPILAACECSYPAAQGAESGDFSLRLIDLSDPLSPSPIGSLEIPFSATASAVCDQGYDACGGVCESHFDESCEQSCLLQCSPDDFVCSNDCYFNCGGDALDGCYLNGCDAGWTVCDSGGSCEAAAASCHAACAAAIEPAGCESACSAWTSFCALTDPPEFYRFAFTGIDYRSPVAAFTQGPYLRVVDFENPSTPELVDSRQSLRLLPSPLASGNYLVGVKLAGRLAFAVERASPNRLFTVDVGDPRNPRLVATKSLQLGTVESFDVEDGWLHVVSTASLTDTRVRDYRLGAPGETFLAGESGSVALNGWVPTPLQSVGDVVTFTRPGTGLFAHHLGTFGSAPRFTSFTCGGWNAEVGDLFVGSCGNRVAVGTMDTTVDSYGWTVSRWMSAPEDASRLLVANGRLWSFPEGRGFASGQLWPWLDESLIDTVATPTGIELIGGPWSAPGAWMVGASTEAGDFEVAAEEDGSFHLTIDADVRGAELVLQAADGTGGGNKLRIRAPLTIAGGSLGMSSNGGARRVARQGDLAAVIPMTVDGGGNTVVRIVDLGNGVDELSQVVVPGVVNAVVMKGNALYLAGTKLFVFDLTVPGQPVASATVDLFSGSPVAALTDDGLRLWALGASGGSQRLLPVDLANPFVPVGVGAQSLLILTSAEPRLFVIGGFLYRIGSGLINKYQIAAGSAPVQVASASPSGNVLVDLELVGSTLWTAIRGKGPVTVTQSGTLLTLGGAPSPAVGAYGLFTLPDAGVPFLWRAAGLAGAIRNDSLREFATACSLRDVEVFASDALLLTDCGLERRVFP